MRLDPLDEELSMEDEFDGLVEEFVDRRKLFADESDEDIIQGMKEEGLLYSGELVSAMQREARNNKKGR